MIRGLLKLIVLAVLVTAIYGIASFFRWAGIEYALGFLSGGVMFIVVARLKFGEWI